MTEQLLQQIAKDLAEIREALNRAGLLARRDNSEPFPDVADVQGLVHIYRTQGKKAVVQAQRSSLQRKGRKRKQV